VDTTTKVDTSSTAKADTARVKAMIDTLKNNLSKTGQKKLAITYNFSRLHRIMDGSIIRLPLEA
jgi:hypothetical protein